MKGKGCDLKMPETDEQQMLDQILKTSVFGTNHMIKYYVIRVSLK